jgi:wobble nucleotide-excising tRNase
MIKRIETIKDFGIYKNFSWNTTPGIDEFKSKNIIYGWNYSGKTTFSRIFSSLRDKKIYKDFPNGDFKIITDVGNFDRTNISTFPYNVLVFNSDYVKDNLKWDFDEEINAISFEVGDNAKIEARIEELETLIIQIVGSDKIIGKRAEFQDAIDEYELFESTLFPSEAKKIKDEHFISLINFTKADLRKIKDQIKEDLNVHIIADKAELGKLSKIIKIEEPKEKISIIELTENNEVLEQIANEILESSPTKSDIIEVLDKNISAYNWVKSGLGLHKSKNYCLFCNNSINEERIKLLNSYFENQASLLRVKCATIFEKINTEELSINTINFPGSNNDFNEGFQDEYKALKTEIDKLISSYKKHLQKIKKQISNKMEINIYSPVAPIEKFNAYNINNLLEKLNKLIDKNNEFSEKFHEIVSTERDKYKKHLVASFLKSSKYFLKENNAKKASKELSLLNEKVKGYNTEIERQKSLKESISEGCAQFNFFVQSFLGRKDIEIKLNEDTKKFNLLRGTELAKNLSEGEKMAISFSHYIVTIKSYEKKNELKDCIIFIDDPISSLDGNHVFQINSLLKEIFFDKIANPNPSQKEQVKVVKCKQLLISTHNFEFFNLLKELPIAKSNESRYFISRGVNESRIEKLPNVYNFFKSEYHFLFSEIVNFNDDENKSASPKLLLMPNILRRFLEMYTLTQYPSADELDERADEVFGKEFSKRICKPFHYFSHFNNIDRIGQQSELVADISNACSTLLKFLDEKKDSKHYLALKKAIS